MPYTIGEEVWHQGDPVTVTTEPYTLYGGEWQDAETEGGKTVTMLTPECRDRQARRKQERWKEEQAAFRRLSNDAREAQSDEQEWPEHYDGQ